MTRDEAINILRKPRDGMNYTESLLVCLVELGVLKLDEPKSGLEKLISAMETMGYNRHSSGVDDVITAIKVANVKIVEK